MAVPETEDEWLAEGKKLSCRKLEREIAGVEKGRRPRGSRRGLPAQVFDVHARIDNVQHEMFETARRKLADIIDEPVDNRFLVMTLVETFLRDGLRLEGGDGEGSDGEGSGTEGSGTEGSGTEIGGHGTEGSKTRRRPRSQGLLYQLIVQQCPGCRETLLHTEDGPVELPKEKGDAIACEAVIHRVDDLLLARCEGNLVGDHLVGDHLVGDTPLIGDRVDIPTPPWMRTLVLLRDGMKCLCCGSRRNLQAHHGRHRVAEKGITHPINLATTCSTCHEGCHNGNLRMVGDADKGWRFLDREGRPLSERVRDPDAVEIQIETPIQGDVVSHGLTGGARASHRDSNRLETGSEQESLDSVGEGAARHEVSPGSCLPGGP